MQHGEVSAGDQKPVQLRRQRAVVEAGEALAGRDGIKAAGGKAGLLGGRAEKADVHVLFPRERLSAADLVFGNIGPGECLSLIHISRCAPASAASCRKAAAPVAAALQAAETGRKNFSAEKTSIQSRK